MGKESQRSPPCFSFFNSVLFQPDFLLTNWNPIPTHLPKPKEITLHQPVQHGEQLFIKILDGLVCAEGIFYRSRGL